MEIKAEGGEAMGVTVNVTDEASVQKMVDDIMEAYGRIDVLVNNAGISQKVTVEDMTLADIRKIFEVNMFGLFLCTQKCMKVMREQKYGRIVNLSSVSGKRGGGVFGGAHYSASKAAVLAFSKNLSREISAEGITVNSVCPGLIKYGNMEVNFQKRTQTRLLTESPWDVRGRPRKWQMP